MDDNASAAGLAIVRNGPAITPPAAPPKADVLPPPSSLAVQINDEHEATRTALANSLRHAIRCGELLNLAQENAKAEKRSWLDWLKDNTTVPQTTASLYMRLAKHAPAINNAVANIPDLSIRNAIKLLPKAAPRGGKSKTNEDNAPDKAPADKPPADPATPPPAIPSPPPPDLMAQAKEIINRLGKADLSVIAEYAINRIKEIGDEPS